MATLTIRNLPDEVHAQLRVRAAKAGRSMEAEARSILAAACVGEGQMLAPSELQSFVDALYGSKKPSRVADALIRDRRREPGSE
ncbi:MAG: hypothetical protein L0Y66_26665 [Myxococcaceae bacterium]|nr:hypothetical protein [Myxococcaceae bacterium]MCI0671001.1 hypothetical protein [Myxococcaceae bacterium]